MNGPIEIRSVAVAMHATGSPLARDGWSVQCVRCGSRARVSHPRNGCPSCGGSVQALPMAGQMLGIGTTRRI